MAVRRDLDDRVAPVAVQSCELLVIRVGDVETAPSLFTVVTVTHSPVTPTSTFHLSASINQPTSQPTTSAVSATQAHRIRYDTIQYNLK